MREMLFLKSRESAKIQTLKNKSGKKNLKGRPAVDVVGYIFLFIFTSN